MGSWRYAYLFPGPARAIRPEEAARLLAARGLKLDDRALEYAAVDQCHFAAVGKETLLGKDGVEALCGLLASGCQLEVVARNKDIYISACFLHRSYNPHIVLAWSWKLFSRLSEAERRFYEELVVSAAIAACCSYVVFVDDPPDYFEDRFLLIDGKRMLQQRLPSGTRYQISRLLVQGDSPPVVVDGKELRPVGRAHSGFQGYVTA